MSLFENFPYTNLHELNLDWLIQEMESLKELVQDGPVISVNGQTGVVTLYQEAQVRLPDVTDAQQTYWNIFRSLNGHLYGIRFDSNGNVYAIRDGINTKLLTWADIPADAGVISVNGLYGVVHISGTDIPWMGGENETVFDKLSENEDAIDNLNIVLGTLTNAIKAGIAYLEPNVDDTAIHNIPAGRYVFWKNYAYKSTQAISIGDTLSNTNLQAVGDGGFINALLAELNTFKYNLATTTIPNIPTLSDLKNTLDSQFHQMSDGDIKIATITFTDSFKPFSYAGRWTAIISREGTNKGYAQFYNVEGKIIIMTYQSNTWHLNRIDECAKMVYIEPTFTNGIATYNLLPILDSYGWTTFDCASAIFNSGNVNSTVIRAIDKTGDTEVKIVTNDSSFNGASGIYLTLYNALP